jgi:mannose-6-phosphate isomerase-like protein (cupin superfamily)
MSATPNGLCVDRWTSTDPPSALELEAKLRAEGLRPYRTWDPPGTSHPPRRHESHEVRWLISGKLWVKLEGTDEAIVLSAGDRLDLPAGLEHTIMVQGDEPAVLVAAAGSEGEAVH